MVKTENVEFIKKCRACLSDPPEMHYIFEEFDQGESLSRILKTLIPFEIEKNDGLSPYLCENCTIIVVNFFNLTLVWQENENCIKTLLKTEVKTEDNVSTITDVCNVDKNESDKSENSQLVAKQSDCESFLLTKCKEVDSRVYPDIVAREISVEIEEKSGINSSYSCESCGLLFLSKSLLLQHKRNKHKKLNPHDYNVSFCPQNSKRSMAKTNPLQCNICKEVFKTLFDVKEHYRVHRNYVCEICGATFLKKSYLNDHADTHTVEKRYVCAVCGKAFRLRNVFVKHKRLHTHPRQHICEVCGDRFNDKGTMKTHFKLKHTKERNFQCVLCGLWFPLKSTLNKHVLRHNETREKPFACSICRTAYKDKSSLNRHMIVKHTNNAKKPSCKFCHKKYTTKTNLYKHIRRHHESTEEANDEADST